MPYSLPAHGDRNWDNVLNPIFSDLDARVSEVSAQWSDAGAIYSPIGLVPDARTVPPRPAETVVTAFQSGHGWTQSGNGSSNLNDTTTFASGTQSIRGTTDGAGTLCNLNSPTLSPALDLTRKYLKILLRVSDPTNLSQISVYAANEVGITNSIGFVFTSGNGGDECLIAGDWVEVTLPFDTSQTFIAGSPNRAAITNIRVGLRDTGSGPITVNVQKISTVDEPYDVWPNGVVSFDFDDCYASHATLAAPYLSQYGWSGTAYPIVDRLGTGAPYATLAQVQSLQRDYGWATGLHSYTQANHDAGLTTLTSAQQQADLRAAKNFHAANGLRADYMAYPRGMFSDTLMQNVRQVAATGRTTYRRYRESWPPADPYRIRAVSVLSTDTLATLKSEIDKAATGRYWLVLVFHDLVTSGATANQWLQADFKALVDYAATTPIAVANIDQVMKARPAPSPSRGELERDLAVGQETFPRLLAATPNAPGTGTIRLAYFTARKTERVASVRCYTGATAPSGITLSRVGLYQVNADNSLTLIGSSANDVTYLATASSTFTKALSSAVQVYAGKRYAIGPLVVGTTPPNLYGVPSSPINEMTQAPRITGAVTGQSDLPSSVSSGSIATSGFGFYFALLPI